MNTVSLDVKLEKDRYKGYYDDEETDYYAIRSIKKDTVELLSTEVDDDVNNWHGLGIKQLPNFDSLKSYLGKVFNVPSKYLKIISNIPQPDLELLLMSSIAL